jgi:hypothetical protein
MKKRIDEDKPEAHNPDPQAYRKRSPSSALASRDENSFNSESENQNSPLFFHESYLFFIPCHADCSVTESMSGNSETVVIGNCPVRGEWWVFESKVSLMAYINSFSY